jgi:hypothetical protein
MILLGTRTALLALCVMAMGCSDAVDDADEEADGESEITSEALTTQGISIPGDNKVCAKVKRTTALHYSTTGAATITTPSGSSVNAGRFVLVQRRPGAVHGRVWADPDLSGLTSSSDNAAVADRCGISRAAAQDARVRATSFPYHRRGWVDVADLTFPNGGVSGPLLSRGLPSNTTNNVLRIVHPIPGCTVDATYHGGSDTRGTGMKSYGDFDGNGLYVLYGTPEIDGGGMTFRYLPIGADWHEVALHRHSGTNHHGQLTGLPVYWSEGWYTQDGGTVRGFVLRNCLK